MRLYKIYWSTHKQGISAAEEAVRYQAARKYLKSQFKSMTQYSTIGTWRGEDELAYIMEYIGPDREQQRVYDIAGNLSNICQQEGVYLVVVELKTATVIKGDSDVT
jgi:hypothetical protein